LKFSIQKQDLQKTLTEHLKVVPLRTTLPVLTCALFEVKKQTLKIKTTDLDQTIISKLNITNGEEGSVAIPIGKLTEIINAMPNEETRFEITEENLVEINNNQGAYKITGRNKDEFPEKNEEETQQNLVFKGEDFLDIVEKTSYAASKDDLKPALTGVYLNVEIEKITAVATDGHKLVKYEKKITNPNKIEQSIIIPSKFFNIIKNTISKKDDVVININTDQILTKQKEFVFISRIIKEKFPDFNSVIPEDNKLKGKLKAKDFLSCIKRISIFSNRTTKQIVTTFNTDGVVVSAEDIETSASGKEHFMCDFEGEEITTSYNAKYLQEVIQHINEEEIEVYLNTPLTAAVLKPTKEKETEKLLTLLMPLRLNT
tara:strand:- start:2992 stop:4107 length:1116 start_codon:yes stop_codon:yes gene_type:complete